MTPNNDPALARTIIGFATAVAVFGALAFGGAAHWAGLSLAQTAFIAMLPPAAIALFWRLSGER